MNSRISSIQAREILDSRGRPTIEVMVGVDSGAWGMASVPSGASVGRHEAVELRDGVGSRYRGLGVRQAISNVTDLIEPALRGLDASDQEAVDQLLVDLDGTADKSHLGANATLGVSLAVARVAAASRGIPLWRHLLRGGSPLLPRPMVNILSGGMHAGGNLDLQDFLIVPSGADTYAEALHTCVQIHWAMKDLLRERGLSTLRADEGGFGPALKGHVEALELMVTAAERAGFKPGHDVGIAIDVAASHFYDVEKHRYGLASEKRSLTPAELVGLLEEWVDKYPICSIEDGLAEDDWDGWKVLTDSLANRVQLVGDDLFTTNPQRLGLGIERGVANAVLVKMNQIGTLTETLRVVDMAQKAGYSTIASARSGETEDSILADITVASGMGQIKIGSVTQSERLAKYNQLTRIEDELGEEATLAPTPALGAR
ncbi:phosphopyruvate hydratase [bacterium]|nr:MAG: phosphopyruvate hydratase [bacterium]